MDGSGGDSADQSAEQLLAEHNLHVTFEELRRVKAAIRSGNLLQLVDRRARGHPAMLDGFRVLLDHADELERTDPVSKDAFFYTSHESARRPEVSRHHDRLSRLAVPDRLLLTESDAPSNHDYDAVWRVKPRSVPSRARSPRRTRSPQRSRSGSTVRRRSRPPPGRRESRRVQPRHRTHARPRRLGAARGRRGSGPRRDGKSAAPRSLSCGSRISARPAPSARCSPTSAAAPARSAPVSPRVPAEGAGRRSGYRRRRGTAQQRAQQLFVRVRCYRRVPSSPDAFIRGSFVDTSKET